MAPTTLSSLTLTASNNDSIAIDFVLLGLLSTGAGVPYPRGQWSAGLGESRSSLCTVAGHGDAFLFGQGQDLVLQLSASHLVERQTEYSAGGRAVQASGGMKAGVASTRDILPVGLLWINTDSGRDKCRELESIAVLRYSLRWGDL